MVTPRIARRFKVDMTLALLLHYFFSLTRCPVLIKYHNINYLEV